jgi:putative colanic acid biosynthesis glycosyltransferase
MKLLQLNSDVNSGSTGRIAEDIGKVLISKGHESYIGYGRGKRPSQSRLIRIGNQWDLINHGLKTAIFDRHGFGSVNATKALIKEIDNIKPDAIGLHNLHGYYLNIEVLFDYLNKLNIPLIWTLFDCWAFTGHCSYFDDINCNKWVTGCFSCPKTKKYPSSYFLDNSRRNFSDKRHLFTKVEKLHIVVHSQWLKGLVEQSFLNIYPVHHIFSGIDLEVFMPVTDNNIRRKYNIVNKKIILGVASIWDTRKGLSDFIKLHKNFPKDYNLVLVGLTQKQIDALPSGIIGIERTESIYDLAALYSAADVFVNPTWQDNFPTTNLEALACGTPVVTYKTGGSPEAIDNHTGLVVEKGDVSGLANAITIILQNSKSTYSISCRERAESLFSNTKRFDDYISLYEKLIGQSQK